MEKAPKIFIEKYSVPLDPSLDVYHVKVEREDGVWEESFPSLPELEAFIKGVKAGSVGHVELPKILEDSKSLPFPKNFQ